MAFIGNFPYTLYIYFSSLLTMNSEEKIELSALFGSKLLLWFEAYIVRYILTSFMQKKTRWALIRLRLNFITNFNANYEGDVFFPTVYPLPQSNLDMPHDHFLKVFNYVLCYTAQGLKFHRTIQPNVVYDKLYCCQL